MTNQATFALIEECRAALAEELSAWDIDPPLHHVKQAHDKCVAWLAATQPAPQPEAQALPREWTPEMSRAVQMHSELGAYAAANLSGAYGLFEEFWNIAHRAALSSPAPAPTVKDSLTVQGAPVSLTDELIVSAARAAGLGEFLSRTDKSELGNELRRFAWGIEATMRGIGLDGGM